MHKVFFQTHGCSANMSESEAMMGQLQEKGFIIVDDPEYAEVNVINICTVKGNVVPLREIAKFTELYPEKKLVVAGCITRDIIPQIRKINESAGLLNTHNIHRIAEVVEETLQGNALEALTQERIFKVDLIKKPVNRIVGIVPISSGCDDRCTYCSVKLIKGNIFSYPKSHIVAAVKKNIEAGCHDIWLTSQDNGAYGLDSGEHKLHILLNAILNKVPGDYKIRLGMINPRHVIAMIDELISIFQDERMYKFLHIPIEAGNNEILGKMNRKYNVHQFKDIVEQFRKYVPKITIASDLIVGFPTETESQFQDSLKVMQEVKPDVLNIARFSPRAYTPAQRMDGQIATNIKKERSKAMTELFIEIALNNNKKWIGWEGSVTITERGKHNTLVGRNFAYKPVIVKGNYPIGKRLNVRIRDVSSYDLKGDVIEKEVVLTN